MQALRAAVLRSPIATISAMASIVALSASEGSLVGTTACQHDHGGSRAGRGSIHRGGPLQSSRCAGCAP
jgi:hypothetical protein